MSKDKEALELRA
jgi:hypothetical protein